MTKLAKKTKHLRKHKIQWLPASAPDRLSDQALFSNISHNHNHVLHNLLPPLKMTGHDLRRPTLDLSQLTKDANNLIRKIFIHRLSNNNYLYSKL